MGTGVLITRFLSICLSVLYNCLCFSFVEPAALVLKKDAVGVFQVESAGPIPMEERETEYKGMGRFVPNVKIRQRLGTTRGRPSATRLLTSGGSQ